MATKSETKDSIEPDGQLSGIFRDDDEFATPGDEDPRSLDIQKCDDDSSEDFKLRLRKELVSRDGHGELWRDINIFLTFKNSELETAYTLHRQPFSSVPLIGFLIVHVAGGLYSIFVLPRTITHFAIVFVPIWILIFLVIISVAESFPAVFPYFISQSSKKFNDCVWLRRMAAIITILIVGLCNCFDMFTSSQLEPTNADNIFVILLNQTIIKDHIMKNVCLFPSYYSNYCVLVLIAVSVIVQLSHISKVILMILIAALHCLINVFYMEKQFTNEEYHTWNHGLPLRYSLSALLVAVTIALSLLARHMDKEDRVIFLWKNEVTEQKEKASDMRRRNEALVYNVLPMHVAEHFMGNRKRSHDELYSQSYAEVGVLFASMPNFSDFYSEETVNNQGLECLRFLNEVISDFDALLELPQFQDITKIKTISSTYMGASGLNPSRQVKSEDPIIIRWAHLALLVEFALELKKALQSINEQSFNHFVLKMGINHGPITAGVIGARKPHYDIWGNTVNVASRMESTGKAGAIQVTEETCEILQTFGYTFEQRGLVAVKGKGQLMTYYLQGKIPRQSMNQSSPMISANMNTMETVQEVEEPHEAPPIKSAAIYGSPAMGPPHPSISSSSASPNSVKLNSNYIDKITPQKSQPQPQQQQHQTKISINIEETNENSNDNDNKTLITNNSSSNNSNSNNVTSSNVNSSNSDSDITKNGGIVNPNPLETDETGNESDVTTPLLNDKNSTNLNSNDYCISEKDALLESSK